MPGGTVGNPGAQGDPGAQGHADGPGTPGAQGYADGPGTPGAQGYADGPGIPGAQGEPGAPHKPDGLGNLDASEGELLIRTGVSGRAAKMGHRLTIKMGSWRAAVRWEDGQPAVAELTVDVGSLAVLSGEGGLTPLSGPEKALARANALKTLGAERFPQIRFHAEDIEESAEGYRLAGTLQIHGQARPQAVDVRVQDLGHAWRLSAEANVRQSDFGVKPYSMLMGAMKVADDVTVSFAAEQEKTG